MSTVSVTARPAIPLHRRRPQPLPQSRNRLIFLALFCAFGSAVFLVFFAGAEVRPILIPLLVCLNLPLFFVAILYRRDGELPVFESGTLWVAATAVYSTFPLVNFLAGGMRWQPPSDWRLVMYDPRPEEMSALAGYHVLYLATFVVVYLILRGKARVPRVFAPVPASVHTAVIVTFVVMTVVVQMVKFVVLPPEASISVYAGGNFAYRANVPYVFLQFLNIGEAALLVLKLLFAILVLARWRERKWRVVLFLWLLFEFLLLLRIQARGSMVLLLLMIGIAYHRLVKPLSLRAAVVAGAALITAFLAFGMLRDTKRLRHDARVAFTVNNEFQALFANAYDIRMRNYLRILPAPPPQMRYAELYMIIPSQILPFPKAEPSEWYAEVLGISDTGARVMFGVITSAMLWSRNPAVEIFLRAVLIATILALLHRWYVRRADRFWPTAVYAYVTVWTYYTFRANTLAPVYLVVYYFGFAAFLVAAVKFALAAGRRKTAALRRWHAFSISSPAWAAAARSASSHILPVPSAGWASTYTSGS